MNEPDVTISNHAEWQNFPGGRPEMVIDPMIYRSADVYLRGRKGAEQSLPGKDSDEVWKALSSNVGSLIAFFDALILAEHLPLIDYGFTYESRLGFEQHELYRRCNDMAQDQLLVSVHVMMEAYQQSKAAAIDALREKPVISDHLAAGIIQELSAFDYTWQPDLSDLGDLPDDENQLAFLRFLYGGLLFTAYAQTTGAAHIMQPKRSRLYLAASLAAPSSAYEYERELYAELRKVMNQTEGSSNNLIEVDALPPFLPLLLSKDPGTPGELLRSALALRNSAEVIEYRKWRRKLIGDWSEKEKISLANEKEIQRMTRDLHRALETPKESELGLGLNFGLTAVSISLERAIPIGRIWGWTLNQLPGRRYTKLLMRMHLAAHEYRKLDRHLLTLWKNA